MTTAQISHGPSLPRVLALWRINFRRKSSLVAVQTQATLSRKGANFGARGPLQAPKDTPMYAPLPDQLPENPEHGHITKGENQGPQIGNTQQEHDGMGKPQPEEGHRPESRHCIGF